MTFRSATFKRTTTFSVGDFVNARFRNTSEVIERAVVIAIVETKLTRIGDVKIQKDDEVWYAYDEELEHA